MTDDRARLLSNMRGATPAGTGRDDEALLEAGIVVRDMRTNERFWVHDVVVDQYGPVLGADIFAIYCSLSCMANKEQYCWPSLSRLARHWGKGRATVVRAVTLLSDLKLIHVQRGMNDDGSKANNVYFLLEPLPIEEGLVNLVEALRKNGATLDDAIKHVVALVPQNWEPLRRKNGRLRSRTDWSLLLESAFVQDPERLNSADKTTQSATEPGGSGTELGGLANEPGGSEAELGGLPADRVRFAGNQDGSAPILPAFRRGPGYASENTTLVPLEDSKVNPTKETPDKALQQGNQHQGPGGVVLRTDEEIQAYELKYHEVFIETDDGDAVVMPIDELARRDIEATAQNWDLRVATDAYYSARQFLGQGGEDWTPDEEQKRSYHAAVRRDLESAYASFGAFSVGEALSRYFTDDLVQRYLGTDPEEEKRIRGWIVYVHGAAGKSIENAAGFLRTRIEGGQWPPRTQARRRER